MKCTICDLSVNKFNEKNNYKISYCERCDFEFVSNRPSRKLLNQLYSKQKISKWNNKDLNKVYQDFVTNDNNPKRDFFDKIINRVKNDLGKEKLDILEIGSGRSDLVYYSNYLGHNCVGIEASNEVVNYLNMFHDNKIIFVENDDYSKLNGIKFDLVYMEHSLEHFLDVNSLMIDLQKLSKELSYIAILVPNHNSTIALKKGINWSEVCPPFHMSFFKPKSLISLLEKYNYKPVIVEEMSYYFRSKWQNYSIDKYINLIILIFNKLLKTNFRLLRYPYKYPKKISHKIRLFPTYFFKTVGEELYILAKNY